MEGIEMKNPYKVDIVGKDGKKNIYGVIYKDKKLSGVAFPNSWGTRIWATRYMVERLLFIPWKEWKKN